MRWNATAAVAAVFLLGGCEPIPFAVPRDDIALLPRDTAVRFLQSLPGGSAAVSPRPNHENCEFSDSGVRVAAANPQYVRSIVSGLRNQAQQVQRERQTVDRDEQRVNAQQNDRAGWMRTHGFGQWADEARRRASQPRTPEAWLQERGLPPDQISRARSEMSREDSEYDRAMTAVQSAMDQERQALNERRRALDRRDTEINRAIETAPAREHSIANYDRAAFVVYRTFRGETNIDIEYERPDQTSIDGCGFGVDATSAEAPAMVRRIATALAALGADGQPGVKAEPPLAAGRRYSAQPPDRPTRLVGQTN